MATWIEEEDNKEQAEACKTAYPDGWTCVACGVSYNNTMPADTSDGTECHKCYKD